MARKPPIFLEHFESIKDPRMDRTKKHKLIDILAIVICAVLSDAEGWDEIVEFAECKETWLKRFLTLDNGIPSADTIRRVISRIHPSAFQQSFFSWIEAVFGPHKMQHVAIDGKKSGSSEAAIHIVSAWAEAQEGVYSDLCLGQVAVADKSNEITAIPELLKILDLKGALLTIDAIGCQKDIVEQIVTENQANYCIAVKANQPELYQTIVEFFDEHTKNYNIPIMTHETVDNQHGRVEHRRYFTSGDIDWFPCLKDWGTVKSIGMVESWVLNGSKESNERRFYILSIAADAGKFAKAVRSHWGIENKLHWVLDVAFSEDASKISDRNAQQNIALIRKMSLNNLQKIKTKNDSFKRMRKRCGWDEDYLLKTLLA